MEVLTRDSVWLEDHQPSSQQFDLGPLRPFFFGSARRCQKHLSRLSENQPQPTMDCQPRALWASDIRPPGLLIKPGQIIARSGSVLIQQSTRTAARVAAAVLGWVTPTHHPHSTCMAVDGDTDIVTPPVKSQEHHHTPWLHEQRRLLRYVQQRPSTLRLHAACKYQPFRNNHAIIDHGTKGPKPRAAGFPCRRLVPILGVN